MLMATFICLGKLFNAYINFDFYFLRSVGGGLCLSVYVCVSVSVCLSACQGHVLVEGRVAGQYLSVEVREQVMFIGYQVVRHETNSHIL